MALCGTDWGMEMGSLGVWHPSLAQHGPDESGQSEHLEGVSLTASPSSELRAVLTQALWILCPCRSSVGAARLSWAWEL